MIVTTPAFKTVIEGRAMRVAYRATIDLPGGVYNDLSTAAETISVSLNTTTDAPDGVRVQPGYTTSTATITLSGTVDKRDPDKTAKWLFGRYQTTSPMYRKHALETPVTIDFGVYVPGSATPELVRKFTGFVDDYTVDHQTGVVTITCVDRHTLFRPASIPGVVPATGITSEYAYNAVARAATAGVISTWPKQRDLCVLSAGCRTSTQPELGGVTLFSDDVYVYAPGVFGSALTGSPTPFDGLVGDGTWNFASNVTNQMFFEAWVTGIDAGTDSYLDGEFTDFTFKIRADGLHIDTVSSHFDFETDAVVVPAPIDSGPHYIALQLNIPVVGGVTWSGVLRVDDASYPFSGTSIYARWRTAYTGAVVDVFGPGTTVEGVQITTEGPGAPWNDQFVPQAEFSTSLNALQVIPPITTTDLWAVMQQISSAELGLCGFDEYGILRSYNRLDLAAVATGRTIYTSGLKGLQEETSASSTYNDIIVPFAPWIHAANGVIWKPTTVLRALRASTTVFKATATDGILGFVTQQQFGGLLNGATPVNPWYRASSDPAGVNEFDNPQDHLSIFGYSITGQDFLIKVTNSSTVEDAYFVCPSNYTDMPVGTPSIALIGEIFQAGQAGQAESQWPPLNFDGTGGADTAPNGKNTYSVTGNPWIQDLPTAQRLSDAILGDLATPTVLVRNVSIVPDPRLQVPDHVLLDDPDRSGIVDYFRLWGWQMQLSKSDWTHTVNARADSDPGGWILGIAGRSEVGETTYT